MTIGTQNVSFSSINAEKSAAAGVTPSNSNLSLSAMARSTMVLNPSNSRQTFTLTDNITLTTQDSAVADNMNLASGPDEVSEFRFLALDGITFSSSSANQNSYTETINHERSFSTNGCFAVARLSARMHASRVGNDLVWYIGEGDWQGIGDHRRETTVVNLGSSYAEVARLAGVCSNTNTEVSVAITQLENTQEGSFIGGMSGQSTVSVVSGGTAGPNNTTSTNEQFGYQVIYAGLGECVSNANVRQRFRLDYTVNHPDHQNRVFSFFMGLRGTYSTSSFTCC